MTNYGLHPLNTFMKGYEGIYRTYEECVSKLPLVHKIKLVEKNFCNERSLFQKIRNFVYSNTESSCIWYELVEFCDISVARDIALQSWSKSGLRAVWKRKSIFLQK